MAGGGVQGLNCSLIPIESNAFNLLFTAHSHSHSHSHSRARRRACECVGKTSYPCASRKTSPSWACSQGRKDA